ncbi:dTDP-4-dehydrorhamnose 3,5-epimerase [Mucilaginibacter daejeonensis]|uniref:dTDP-4-dehydrorhamnose 3,5-epimerase n=1 Tax=Mucilaginibacter daejeonensis TaxID=398049 RepID=UPI001D17218E|nr:dTDP-4-dehydrorhamnose 3,5-epimerase [Mucilaginibacter daejeonensis]UEG54944.1 dTDP-4-dehydrorhamnose 3,5-epimerase [Mucilaginibacter daejeonensis]
MGTEIINGVYYSPLNIISTTGGTVMHAIKGIDEFLPSFGECYFSTAKSKDPKAWKKHSRMICNLFVPKGEVKFVFFDDRVDSVDYKQIAEFNLGQSNYGRLTIFPNVWFGFAGVADNEDSLILNVANILHEPSESSRLEPDTEKIPYVWKF